MRAPIIVTWQGYDVDASEISWDTYSETFTDWLDAAHTISAVSQSNIINLRLADVTSDDLEGFRAYCSKLSPRGLRW